MGRLKNKNGAYPAMDWKKIEELVIKVLKLGQFTNREYRSCKGVPLSKNAKYVLKRNKLGKSFMEENVIPNIQRYLENDNMQYQSTAHLTALETWQMHIWTI